MVYECDYLIVGAGIVGLALAKALVEQGVQRIILIEKEAGLGFHASGRNSGVLHAGIYYPPHTLKAKLCLKGNKMLQAYCMQKNLPLKKTGKVIVARSAAELPALHALYARAKENGAHVALIDEKQLVEYEPYAKTYEQAIISHDTALIDNKAILAALQAELIASKRVQILFHTPFEKLKDDFHAQMPGGVIRFSQLINTAGAYADKIAHHFGVGKDYYFIPFKGIYQKLIAEKAHLVQGNIYPIPNLGNPFLGVHFTKSIHGDAYVGPTAIPAFGRENYGMFKGIDREFFAILLNELLLYCVNAEFRKVALEEPKKYLSSYFYRDARKLVKELEPSWLKRDKKVGIRPQLISLSEKKLMMDFLVIKERHSLHVLNAISPAFTSAMAFADYVMTHYIN